MICMAKNQNNTEKKPSAPGSKPQAPKHRRGSSNKRPNKAAIVESVTRDELLSELESTPLRKSAPRHQRGGKMSDADLRSALADAIHGSDSHLFAVITVDRE